MPREKRGVVLAAAILLTASLLWILAGDPSPSAPERDREPLSSATVPRTDPTRVESSHAPLDAAESVEPKAQATGVVAGRIVWPDGAPFTGALIQLLPRDRDSEEVFRVLHCPPGGRFRFEDLPDACYTLRADQVLGVEAQSIARWVVRPRREEYLLIIEDRPERPFLQVRVEDPGGRPVREAKVRVEVLGSFGGLQDREIEVRDGAARCCLRFAARRVLLAVHDAVDREGAPLGETALGPVEISTSPVLVRLPGERVLRGRVTDPEGDPVPGVKLTAGLAPPVLNWIGRFDVGIHDTLVTSDEWGEFEFRGLGDGSYRLRVRPDPPWIAPPERRVEPEIESLRIELRRGVEARVRVVDPEGRPVAGCGLYLLESEVGVADTDREGATVLPPLEPELAYTLHCQPRNRPPMTIRMLDLDESGEMVVELDEEGRASRRLADRWLTDWHPEDATIRLQWRETAPDRGPDLPPADSPFAGKATLRLRIENWPEHHDALNDAWGELVCEDGSVRTKEVRVSPPDVKIRGLRPDRTYTLRLAAVGTGLALEAKGLRPGGEPVEAKLSRGLTISGRILLPPGADYASIDAVKGELRIWHQSSALVHPDGSFEISGLLPGVWRLGVSVSAGGRWYGAEVDVAAGEQVRITPRQGK
jgi:hypothetical protein